MIKLIKSGIAGKNWYRKYSDGWIEQGGYVGAEIGTDDKTINPVEFNIPFLNKPLSIRTTVNAKGTGASGGTMLVVVEPTITKTGFGVVNDSYGSSDCVGYFWEASGY